MKTQKHKLYLVSLLVTLSFFSCKISQDNTTISGDGVQIAFNQQGEGDPAIIFVHGWTNSKIVWNEQVDYFSKKYKAVAVDLAGSGESGNNRSNWTITAFADDVVAVVQKLKLKEVVLVGFSMGAPVVIEAANLLPDKVIGVVLVDQLQNPDIKFSPQMIAMMDSVMMNVSNKKTNKNLVEKGFYKKNHEASFKRIQEMYPEGVSKVGWRESLIGNFNWYNTRCTSSLKQLKTPLVAINSDSKPTMVEAMKNYVPGFKAKIMSDVGHLVFWDKPEEFHLLLEESIYEFLKK